MKNFQDFLSGARFNGLSDPELELVSALYRAACTWEEVMVRSHPDFGETRNVDGDLVRAVRAARVMFGAP